MQKDYPVLGLLLKDIVEGHNEAVPTSIRWTVLSADSRRPEVLDCTLSRISTAHQQIRVGLTVETAGLQSESPWPQPTLFAGHGDSKPNAVPGLVGQRNHPAVHPLQCRIQRGRTLKKPLCGAWD